jgi:hypothetical protein
MKLGKCPFCLRNVVEIRNGIFNGWRGECPCGFHTPSYSNLEQLEGNYHRVILEPLKKLSRLELALRDFKRLLEDL